MLSCNVLLTVIVVYTEVLVCFLQAERIQGQAGWNNISEKNVALFLRLDRIRECEWMGKGLL